MIISKTPFRISFFGGGSDFPSYFLKNGGSCLSTSIDKYCYVNIRKLPQFFEYTNEIVYSKIEQVKNINEIEHPLIKNILTYLNISNIKISYDADLPARTGLGTSSSFAVGIIKCLSSLLNLSINTKQTSDLAIFIERELCKEDGGIQDQIAASFGGFNIIEFKKNNINSNYIDNTEIKYNYYDYDVNKISIDKSTIKNLNNNLLLYFTGISRNSFEIQKKTENNIQNNINKIEILNNMVYDAIKLLSKNKLDDFGLLLNQAWNIKKSLNNQISSSYIDSIYNEGLNLGALGGKILGAGGGGFILFYVPTDKINNFKNIMNKKLLFIPFNFESNGSQIIYKDNN